MTTKPEVKYQLMLLDDYPESFMLIRNINEYSTHYLGPDGTWQAWPEDDNDLADLFETIKDNADSMLPKFEVGGDDQDS